jgi:hypothetical protein
MKSHILAISALTIAFVVATTYTFAQTPDLESAALSTAPRPLQSNSFVSSSAFVTAPRVRSALLETIIHFPV